MRWYFNNNVRVEIVPDPKRINLRDTIVKICSTAICASDLHLYDGYVPPMQPEDIIAHEFMGDIVEVGKGVRMQIGVRVVVPVLR